MADNTSKRRRGSSSKQDLPNTGQQFNDPRDASRRGSLFHSSSEWYSSGTGTGTGTGTGSQKSANPARSSIPPDPSMIGQQNSEGKMLLMPLPRRIAATSRIAEKNRTTHACDLCRKAKAKCTGEQPCQKCKNEGKECIYGDGKRDKERKVLQRTARHNESLRAHTQALKCTLRDVLERTSLSEVEQNKIAELLAKSPSAVSEEDDDNISQQSHFYQLPESQGEMSAGGDVGSTGSLDAIDVDTNRDAETRATGFLGKSSSTRWIQRAEKEVCENDGNTDEKIEQGLPPAFLTGDPDLCEQVAGSDDSWKYGMPALDIATRLVDCYFAHVHPGFPILFKDEFMGRFRYYSQNQGRGFSETDRMALCQINCVFAISCTFTHLISPEYKGDHRDHLIYYARTRALGLEQQPDNAHTSLDYVCALGLLGLYLVSNYYINRAWNTVGLAIRNAVTLGLHVRSEASQLSGLSKELRVRAWWSLFSLEHLLNEITGRPSCISYRDISAPQPVNYSEEELLALTRQSGLDVLHSNKKQRSSEGREKGKALELRKSREMAGLSNLAPHLFRTFTATSHFVHRTALIVLTNEIINRLFCATLVSNTWNEVQDTIREIDTRLQRWKSHLPDELQVTFNDNVPDEHQYQKKGLAIMYYSARMILHRPALCRMEGRIRNESSTSQKFNRDAVAKCVESARALLATVGKPADPTRLYLIEPWWEILHHLCQAASILMLEISFCACHIRNEAHEILQDAKDAVHWLRIMSERSIPARKAWLIHDHGLRIVARNIDADLSDMVKVAEFPPGWKTPEDHLPPHSQETLPQVHHVYDELSGNQSRNLAATSAWVQQAPFQNAGASQPEINQAYAPADYTNQPDYLHGEFEPNAVNPYAIFDNPSFPNFDHHALFLDPPQDMQETQWSGNTGTYEPYSNLAMGMGSHLQEDTAHSSNLQDNTIIRSSEHGFQNVEDQYPGAGSYHQQW